MFTRGLHLYSIVVYSFQTIILNYPNSIRIMYINNLFMHVRFLTEMSINNDYNYIQNIIYYTILVKNSILYLLTLLL